MPKDIEPGMTIDDIELAVPIGRSWIKFARIPVDYDDLCLVERGPGMRFLERSKLGERARRGSTSARFCPRATQTCEITDRLAIELRSPLRAIGGGRMAPRIIQRLFTHRHKRLAERWGTPRLDRNVQRYPSIARARWTFAPLVGFARGVRRRARLLGE